jgi:cell division protein FtsW (lipid II flippase)
MFFLKFLKILGIITIYAGAVIGTSNENLDMEKFYYSTKIAWALIAAGLAAIIASHKMRKI